MLRHERTRFFFLHIINQIAIKFPIILNKRRNQSHGKTTFAEIAKVLQKKGCLNGNLFL
jgi:hypothetical protein